ncbi:MAG: tetratricopeptide repeat protein [Mojavia pulchra JT2-VF2]|jgi:Tfp pilus assembly protein PilF|uniref:Tetratricopeptide repeat protein n=1 Tax=Mojavia pulchra JT2-VF2 TaxID=287848 RepID=A0A951PVV9_9NOST|nr:tetratricopeptide repeat protein [Mojavia pulchra JT2-VF2]
MLLPQEAVPIITEVIVKPEDLALDETSNAKPSVNKYAQRHYQRAIEYNNQANWTQAVQELRDAIKLEPNNSDYHALLGLVHLQQNLRGMAMVYIRQALKLNPQNQLALKYAANLKIKQGENTNPKSMATAISIAAILSFFSAQPRSGVKW